MRKCKTRAASDDDANAYEQARGFRAQLLELKAQLNNCDNTRDVAKIEPAKMSRVVFADLSACYSCDVSMFFTRNLLPNRQKIGNLAPYVFLRNKYPVIPMLYVIWIIP